VYIRLAALAAICVSFVFAQTGAPAPAPGAAAASVESTTTFTKSWELSPNALQPNQNDPSVVRARQALDQVSRLVASGALPAIRLRKAQEDVQDALDSSILKMSLYSTDLLPEQADQMIYVAQRMVVRRQKAMFDMQELVSAGVISRSEAEASGMNLERAKEELEWAQSRAALIEQIAQSVRLEKEIASLESQAESHPEWAGKVYTKYDGSGVFTATDRKLLEVAYATQFSRSLPISADGGTALHRSMGFDHRGRMDVAVTPDQPEGRWLMKYLESKHIPFFAFRAAVPHQATGAHIHVGPGSTRLTLSD
jgi:hypothetical protein